MDIIAGKSRIIQHSYTGKLRVCICLCQSSVSMQLQLYYEYIAVFIQYSVSLRIPGIKSVFPDIEIDPPYMLSILFPCVWIDLIIK